MILFGHPTGSPFSHNAALAHFEAGVLDGFCVPWMPTPLEIGILSRIPGIVNYAARLSRRSFAPLAGARLVEGRLPEWGRMARRILPGGRFDSEALSYEANDWLVRTMQGECSRPLVTAVHSYEDCSQGTFETAKVMGKACIYDLPIGYYPAWEERQAALAREFADWLPAGGLASSRFARPEQKKAEMDLADLVLVPCRFVQRTIEEYAEKPRNVSIAPYGVDAGFWAMKPQSAREGPLRFIYAGQCSLRKGIPVLLEAWRIANLPDATLDLVGGWHLDEGRRGRLPAGVRLHGPVASQGLREHFQRSDVFVFPSWFEGFGLVILEAMACGLPVIATEATAGPDVLTPDCGRVIEPGDLDALVDSLRWFSGNRGSIARMGTAARIVAELHTWARYRECVSTAVAAFAN